MTIDYRSSPGADRGELGECVVIPIKRPKMPQDESGVSGHLNACSGPPKPFIVRNWAVPAACWDDSHAFDWHQDTLRCRHCFRVFGRGVSKRMQKRLRG